MRHPAGSPNLPDMPRLSLRRSVTALLALPLPLALAVGCESGSTGLLPKGAIALSVVTTGVDLDPDGYSLVVDGGQPKAIPSNGTVVLGGTAGAHSLALGGFAFNCDSTAPTSARIAPGDTTRVEIRLACTPFLQGSIVYIKDPIGTPAVMVMRADGSRRQRLTTDQAAYSKPSVSPDGQTIAVGSGWGDAPRNAIALLDRFGRPGISLVGPYDVQDSPAWSADGQRLAFRSQLTDTTGVYDRIFVVNRGENRLRQLSVDPGWGAADDVPSWSPDGTQVVYSREGVLHVVGADGTGDTSLGVAGIYPSWSPDGQRIAYEARVGPGYVAIFVADRDGANARQITSPPTGGEYPRWSPDGQRISFHRVENGNFQIYVVSPDGSNLTRLSSPSASEGFASWGPAVVSAAPSLNRTPRSPSVITLGSH